MMWSVGVELAQRALVVAACAAAPVLAIVLAVGVVVNLAQAATAQSDPTTATVPRLLAAALAVALFGAWMLSLLTGFWSELWFNIPHFLH